MDPPRQVSRRGPGSGPVFRSFKRIISQTVKALPRPPVVAVPKSIAIPVTTSAISSTDTDPPLKRCKVNVELPQKVAGRLVQKCVITMNQNFETETSAQPWNSSQIAKGKAATKPIQIVPLRKHPITAEIREEDMVSVPEKVKKMSLSRSQRSRVKRQLLESEKIALPEQSENPHLDELWSTAAEDWLPLKIGETSVLTDLQAECLPGCLEYIEKYYDASQSEGHEGCVELNRQAAADVIGADVVLSAKYLPPCALLYSGGYSSKYWIEPNEVLGILSQQGGGDEEVWEQLQCLRAVHHRDDVNATQSTCTGTYGTRATMMHSVRAVDGALHAQDISGSGSEVAQCVADTAMRIEQPSSSTDCNPVPCEVTDRVASIEVSTGSINSSDTTVTRITGPRSMRKAVSTADSLLGLRLPRLVREGDSTLIQALLESVSATRRAAASAPSSSSSTSSSSRDRTKHKSSRPLRNCKKDVSAAGVCSESKGDVVSRKGYACLGKRGRRYVDVWNEEDFLFKSKQGHLFDVIDDWSDLVKGYSDTHDGVYRDWSVHQTSLLLNKIKRSSKLNTGLMNYELISPPAPVTSIHPACWSLRAREGADEIATQITGGNHFEKNNANDKLFEIVHPACLSKKIVQSSGSAATRKGLQDIDDLSIHTETLQREMLALEASNYLRLQALKGYVAVASQLDAVKERRAHLELVLTQMYQCTEFEYQTTGKVTYPNQLTPFGCPDPVPNPLSMMAPLPFEADPYSQSRSSEETLAMSALSSPATTRYGTRCAISSLTKAAAETEALLPPVSDPPKPRYQLGACLMRHVPHAEFVTKTRIGDLMEVFSQGSWKAGCVTGLRRDGHLLRHVKISPLGACVGDHLWAAVEDARLAPPGTHLCDALFRWKYSSYVPTSTDGERNAFNTLDEIGDLHSRSDPYTVGLEKLAVEQALRPVYSKNSVREADTRRKGVSGVLCKKSSEHRRAEHKFDECVEEDIVSGGIDDIENHKVINGASSNTHSSSSSSSSDGDLNNGTDAMLDLLSDEEEMTMESDTHNPLSSPISPYRESVVPSFSSLFSSSMSVASNAIREIHAAFSRESKDELQLPDPLPLNALPLSPEGGKPWGETGNTASARKRPLSTIRTTDWSDVTSSDPPSSRTPKPPTPSSTSSSSSSTPKVTFKQRPRAKSDGERRVLRDWDYVPPQTSAPSTSPLAPPQVPPLVPVTETVVQLDQKIPPIASVENVPQSENRQHGNDDADTETKCKVDTKAGMQRQGVTTVSSTESAAVMAISCTSSTSESHAVSGQNRGDMRGQEGATQENKAVELEIKQAESGERGWSRDQMTDDKRLSVSGSGDGKDSHIVNSIQSSRSDQRISKREKDSEKEKERDVSRSPRSGESRGREGRSSSQSRDVSRSRSRGSYKGRDRERGRSWREHSFSGDRSGSRSEDRDRRSREHGRSRRPYDSRAYSRSRSRSRSRSKDQDRDWRDSDWERGRERERRKTIEHRDFNQSRFMDMHREGREKRENRSIGGRSRDREGVRESVTICTSSVGRRPLAPTFLPPHTLSYAHLHPHPPPPPHFNYPYMVPTHTNLGPMAPAPPLGVSTGPHPHSHKTMLTMPAPMPLPPPPLTMPLTVPLPAGVNEQMYGIRPLPPPAPGDKERLASYQILYGAPAPHPFTHYSR